MKVLKKINKGLILTILVLIVLVIYFSNLEKQRASDKTDIKKVCESFIELTDKYSVLPEELQTLKGEVPEDKVKEYTNQMKKDLTEIMIDNQESVNIQQKILEESLRNGYSEGQVRTNWSRKIQKVSSYQFEKNQVTVSLKDNIEETIKTSDGSEEYNKNNEFEASKDEIVLQKVNGKWKVVYANLLFDDNTSYYYDGMERTIVY